MLSGKKVSFVILLLSIGSRLIQIFYFFNLRSDRSFQTLSTYNLLNGHGISISYVEPNDLSTVVYKPLINWPPGYSLLTAPFYKIFNYDYVTALMLVDMLFAILLILISRKILRLLNVSQGLINIYTVVAGFFIYPFYYISSTDSIAICFFVAAIYFTLQFIKKNDKWILYTSIITLMLMASAALKYLFMPTIFVIPVFLIIKGMRKAGAISLIILALTVISILFYHNQVSGTSAYVAKVATGFYPENLLSAYPFIPASFIQPNSIGKLASADIITYVLQGVDILLGIAILFFVWKMYRTKGFRAVSLREDFFYLSFLISAVVVGLLIFLSVRYGKQNANPGVLWTFVEDARYYGLPILLIQLCFFVIGPGNMHRVLWYGLLILLLFEVIRGAIFDSKRVLQFNKEEYIWQYEKRIQQYGDSLINKLKKENPGRKIVFAANSDYARNRISLYSHIPFLKSDQSFNELHSLNTKKPVLLLVMLEDKYMQYFQSFISSKEVRQTGKTDVFSFYTVYVDPH